MKCHVVSPKFHVRATEPTQIKAHHEMKTQKGTAGTKDGGLSNEWMSGCNIVGQIHDDVDVNNDGIAGKRQRTEQGSKKVVVVCCTDARVEHYMIQRGTSTVYNMRHFATKKALNRREHSFQNLLEQ
jgi:hypothetical protein